ncbi:hypothetical protein QBC46DRAFT_392879 [Diplogelasinospora grovesii]|uniref:Secreted protein n=1 Tax=Diplogelasinospora grovesii TaxID=303347 RepID=A0AAN6N1B8_9PEZI|nr:hypothetical protein QBC46DRAFT_392879 [Diplogelasinospora grovesii]
MLIVMVFWALARATNGKGVPSLCSVRVAFFSCRPSGSSPAASGQTTATPGTDMYDIPSSKSPNSKPLCGPGPH